MSFCPSAHPWGEASLHSCRPDNSATCLSCDAAEGTTECFSAIPVGIPGKSTYFHIYYYSYQILLKEEGIWRGGGEDNADNLPKQIAHVT